MSKKPPSPTRDELETLARQVIEQWEKHDQFRLCDGDEAMLIHGKPLEVWLAMDYLDVVDQLAMYEAEDYDRQMGGE